MPLYVVKLKPDMSDCVEKGVPVLAYGEEVVDALSKSVA